MYPLYKTPITALFLLLSLSGFLLVSLPAPVEWVRYFTFSDFILYDGRMEFLAAEGQYWRLITPIFLHFTWSHILINCLLFGFLAGRIERSLGSPTLLLLVVVIGVGSNVSQHVIAGPSFYGGMSAVGFGLLAFSICHGNLKQDHSLKLPVTIFAVVSIWLILSVLIPEILGVENITNAAHLTGLILGVALGTFHIIEEFI